MQKKHLCIAVSLKVQYDNGLLSKEKENFPEFQSGGTNSFIFFKNNKKNVPYAQVLYLYWMATEGN